MRGGNDPKLTRSVRRHICAQKAKIRRETADAALREQKIAELYSRFGVSA
jgi:hypothetical protein